MPDVLQREYVAASFMAEDRDVQIRILARACAEEILLVRDPGTGGNISHAIRQADKALRAILYAGAFAMDDTLFRESWAALIKCMTGTATSTLSAEDLIRLAEIREDARTAPVNAGVMA